MVRYASETKTKIVCTIGPASSDRETLRRLIRAGMDVARINFSHGSRETNERAIRLVREVAEEEESIVAVMADLQGPKLRIGRLAEPIDLTPGDWVSFTGSYADGTHRVIPLPHPELIAGSSVGDRLLLDDGAVEVEVREVRPEVLIGRIVVGGELSSHKGIAAPGGGLRIDALTEKDREDARFAVECGVDFVALSFVRSADDLEALRTLLDGHPTGVDVGIVAKVEKAQAVDRLSEILHACDAVMVARGDLGIEVSAQRVPILQKEIIRRCNRWGIPVITATQMLQSMIENPRPTRAEASDVANAILDGTDAVMLSAETAIGRYPVEAVAMIREISAIAEPETLGRDDGAETIEPTHPITDAIGRATVRIACEIDARLIITSTSSGYTARQIARERPHRPIVAFTPRETTLRRLALVWGVTPVLVPASGSTDEMLETVGRVLQERGEAKPGDAVVVTGGIPSGNPGTTNFIKVHRI